MNAPLRRVAIACLVMFGALLLNANWLQVVHAKALHNKTGNTRVLLSELRHQRGLIVAGNITVARSVPINDKYKYKRVYPNGPEYAPITGYFSILPSITGTEQAENSILSGDDDRLFVRRISDLLTGRTARGGTVVLTVNPKAQDAAYKGLGSKTGAVVAIDPRNGAILALASTPSYDPNQFASHNPQDITRTASRLADDPHEPLLDRAIAQTYPPGSTFKVITSAAALASGKYQPTTVIPAPHQLKLPLSTKKLSNFGNETCSGSGHMTLQDALRISCNTAFGALGMRLGADALGRQAAKFGFGMSPGIPLPTVPSVFPDNLNLPQTAQSAIGQFDVRVTPLQMALVAAGIANHGVIFKPNLVKEVQNPDLSVLDQAQPEVFARPLTAPVTDQLTSMMVRVVQSGTGTNAQIPGVTVAGKTGTAQHGTGQQPPDAWFIAFAPVQDPVVAVAVLVENGGDQDLGATGGKVAAPIARAVMEAVLGR
ncbi:MAG: peptidoglycan D,D-transpeptidase FtsI family protein [Actinomycetes bacterium]